MSIISLLKKLVSFSKCPDCRGEIESMLDASTPYGGNMIYICKKCGKEWV